MPGFGKSFEELSERMANACKLLESITQRLDQLDKIAESQYGSVHWLEQRWHALEVKADLQIALLQSGASRPPAIAQQVNAATCTDPLSPLTETCCQTITAVTSENSSQTCDGSGEMASIAVAMSAAKECIDRAEDDRLDPSVQLGESLRKQHTTTTTTFIKNGESDRVEDSVAYASLSLPSLGRTVLCAGSGEQAEEPVDTYTPKTQSELPTGIQPLKAANATDSLNFADVIASTSALMSGSSFDFAKYVPPSSTVDMVPLAKKSTELWSADENSSSGRDGLAQELQQCRPLPSERKLPAYIEAFLEEAESLGLCPVTKEQRDDGGKFVPSSILYSYLEQSGLVLQHPHIYQLNRVFHKLPPAQKKDFIQTFCQHIPWSDAKAFISAESWEMLKQLGLESDVSRNHWGQSGQGGRAWKHWRSGR